MNAKTPYAMATLAAIAAAAPLLSGCAHHGYGTGAEPNFVQSDTASLPDLLLLTDQMVEKLCSSAAFKAKYDEVKSGPPEKALPVLQVGDFENQVAANSGEEDIRQYTAKLDICRTRVREALQDRGLFRLVDDAGARGSDSGTLNRGMAKDVDDGLVDPGNLQYAGTYAAADFRMLGSLRRVSDGGSHYFVLDIRLYDLRSREFWTSTKILEKF